MSKTMQVIDSTVILLSLVFGVVDFTCAQDDLFPQSPESLFDRATMLFFDGQPTKSAGLFDKLAEARPELVPGLWQRGIALYYAERFAEGRKQFELHRTVNPNDVENPAWHYLCVARASTPEQAREAMLPVGQDSRVPMRQILALFKGDGSAENVLVTASRGDGKTLRNQLCYAHLYLGLYAEARGDVELAKKHILLAAGPFSMDHYMGRVAKVHAQLREWNEQK